MKVPFRFANLFGRHRHTDVELDEEIRGHLEEKIEHLVARGLSKREAEAQARREFGNISVITETSRDEWRWPWLEALRVDSRYAMRLVARYPAFSTNVILVSAIGIAACATTFSLVSGVLLTPLPFAKSENVYDLELASAKGDTSAALSVSTYRTIERGSPVIEAIAASAPSVATVRWSSEPDRVRVESITPSFFRVFGVQPVYGRVFSDEETKQGAPVVLIGHELWQARYGGDSAILGKAIVLDGIPNTIIGVMPRGFQAHYSNVKDVWQPMRLAESNGSVQARDVNAQVRVREGVTQAEADLWLRSAVRDRIARGGRPDSVDATAFLVPIRNLVYGEALTPLRILLGAVLLVLLLVVANVATMFLARSSTRNHELAVRRALGASMSRQLLQLVTESVVLVSIGGAIGTFASFVAVSAVRALGTGVLPRMDAVSFDWRVALFAVVATAFTGALGGLPPAFAARRDLRNAAGGSRVTGRRTSSLLVVTQISLSVVLLVGAGLLVKGFLRVVPTRPGYATENRLMLMVAARGFKHQSAADSNPSLTFTRQVAERMREVSGVGNVAAMTFVPFSGSVSTAEVELSGYPKPEKPLSAYQNIVSDNLIDVLEMKIRRGRGFLESDRVGTERVVVVNETAAKRWWSDEDPIGKIISVKRRTERISLTVVGVMSDARMFGRDTRIRPEVYLPLSQNASGFVTFVVHTDGRSGAIMPSLKRAIWAIEPELHIENSGELASYAMDTVRRPRFFAWAMGLFAAVGLMLSAVAVYGLLTLDVVQRKQEIGVRMALGASGGRIGGLVLKRAFLLGSTGVLIGIVSARALGRFMESLLTEVKTTDGTVFGVTVAVALAVACIAAGAPAWRAVKVDPIRSLRGE